MSHKSSKHSAERSAYSQGVESPRPSTSPSNRKRSNTKYSLTPPTIHLSLKKSSSTFFSSSPRSPIAPSSDYEGSVRKTSAGPEPTLGSPSSIAHSTPTHSGRSPTHTLGYGQHKSTSVFAASPDRLSLLTVPTSLPGTLSALSSEVSLELVQPSPSSVSSMRRPSSSREHPSSPYMRGHLPSKAPSISNLHAASRTAVPSAPTSRKGSGGSAERDAGMHLDMKRLLSKPGSSSAYAASDSETSYYRRGTSLSQKPSAHRMTAASGPTRRATDEPITRHALRESETKNSPVSEAEGERVHKQRNVLRRKSSARSNPATPTASTFQRQQEALPLLPTEARSASKIRESRSPKRSTSATAQIVSLSSIKRRQSPPPRDLTPAGAVALAYKQQEQRREALEEMTGSNDHLRGGTQSLRERSADSRATYPDDDEEGSGAYYTVFGGAVGKVVAVGSAEDSSWDLDFDPRFGHERFSSKSSLQSPSSAHSVPGVRSLGRKVSGRFKKSHDGPRHRAGDFYDGRPSTSNGRPTITSLDEYVDVRTQITAGVSPVSGTPEKKLKDTHTLRSMRSFVGKEKESEKPREEEGPSSGKLWKLMKRISTGGLREKFTQNTAPPPVPALPDNLKHMASSRMTFDIRDPNADSNSETGLKQFMTSRTSMSAVRPSTAPGKGSPRADRPGSRPSTGPRPSTTTRSSSPMSSDIGSSRFFPKSQSTRSSMSSYGEELPPMPSASGVGQNIMSPGELYKLGKDVEELASRKSSRRSRSRSRAHSLGNEETISPADEIRPSLPPPKRSATGGKTTAESESDPPSPMIPSFDISEPMNDFSSATMTSQFSLPTSEFGVMDTTPPRPKRSSRRKPPPPFDLVSPTASTPISPPMPVTPRTPRTPNVPAINVDIPNNIDRESIAGSSHSTAREGYSASPSSAHFRSPLRFRELEAPRTQLSEKEKAAKWDDLLARSEEAGGTLHIGETGLMSDNIRFSEYSVDI